MKSTFVLCCMMYVTSSAADKHCDRECWDYQAELEQWTKLRITELISEGMAPETIQKAIGAKSIWVSGETEQKDMLPVWIGEAVDAIWGKGVNSTVGSEEPLYRNFPGYLCKRVDGTVFPEHDGCYQTRETCSSPTGRLGFCEVKPAEQAPPQWGTPAAQGYLPGQSVYACMRGSGKFLMHIDSSCEFQNDSCDRGTCKEHKFDIPLEYAKTVELLQKALWSLTLADSTLEIQKVLQRFTVVPSLVERAAATLITSIHAPKMQPDKKSKSQTLLKRGGGRRMSEAPKAAIDEQLAERDHRYSNSISLAFV